MAIGTKFIEICWKHDRIGGTKNGRQESTMEQVAKNNMARGVFCTLLGGCLWGLSGNCGQYLFSNYGVDPQWLTVVRMVGAGTVSTLITLCRNRAGLQACLHSRRDLALLVAYGILGLLLSQYTYLEAIKATNAGTATVLQYTGPVLIMMLVCVTGRRLPRLHEGVSVVLVVLGTFLIATHGEPGSLQISSAGLFWGMASAVTLVLYTLLPKSLTPRYGSFLVTGAGTLIGGLAFFLVIHPWPLTITLPPDGWLAVMGMVVLGTLVAYPLYLQGVSDIGPVKASMIASVEPLSATVLSVFWLGSPFTVWDGLGFVCIIATVFLLARTDEEKS